MDVNTDLDSSERASKFSDFFIFKKELGEGSFGRVVAAVYLKTGQECAVKVRFASFSIIHTPVLRLFARKAQKLSTWSRSPKKLRSCRL